MRRKITEFYRLKSSKYTVAGGVGVWRGCCFLFCWSLSPFFCGPYAQKSHPYHGASCLVLAMSAWSVKTRRAPSRHCRDASVYGHTPTAMHDIEYPPLLHASELRSGVSKRTLFSLPRYYGGHLHFSMLFPSSTRVERINAYSV